MINTDNILVEYVFDIYFQLDILLLFSVRKFIYWLCTKKGHIYI